MNVEHLHNDGLSVAELLKTTALERATLRAGAGGLQRLVRRVQWMEVLDDFANYLADGDLLLTTAYNLGADAALQRSLARRMQQSGVVAMVVKCGYYLDEVPYPVRKQADRVELPVFELPREVPFVEVSQSIYERLVSRSYTRLRRAAHVHRELVRLVLAGDDLGTIVRRAAALLGNPVVVEDAAGRPLAGSGPDGTPHPLPPRTLERLSDAIVAPVMARGMLHGRVGLLALRTLGDDDPQALEQVAAVIALEIARSEQELRAERERVAEFVRDLVAGAAGDAAGARRRAAVLGVELPERPAVAWLMQQPSADGLWAAEGDETVAVLEAGDLPRGPGGVATAGGVEGLVEANRRARRAWVIGRAIHGQERLYRYEEIETYDAVLGDLEGARMARVRERTIDRLPGHLRGTLACYLESGGNVATTARQLFVHRNTVHHRLRRIEHLTGLDLHRLEDRLLCELALLADRVNGSRS